MYKILIEKYKIRTVIRRFRKVAAFAVLVPVIFIGGFLLQHGSVSAPSDTSDVVTKEQTPAEAVMPPAYPEQIRIPKIGVDALFEAPLSVDAQREIETPEAYETVAYYKHGPTPGELGPAVVLGHVDSVSGPAVFYSLGQLEEGDTIEIDRDDGTTAVFEVERLERHMQSGFPTQKVYGDLDYAGLRLITCSGTYDRGVARYTHNLIVFARLVTPDSE